MFVSIAHIRGDDCHKEIWDLIVPMHRKRDFIFRVDDHKAFIVSESRPNSFDSIRIYDPVINVGDEFVFALRADASVTLPRRGTRFGLPLNKCVNWLLQRCDRNGFSVSANTVMIDRYTTMPIKGSDVTIADFSGVLTVTDVNKFKHALFHGIGHSKAFGCGLLQIRRS